MRQTFNPDDWSDENEDDSQQPSNLSGFQKPDRFNDSDDIDRVVSRIEAMQTDMTGSYTDWRNLGFAHLKPEHGAWSKVRLKTAAPVLTAFLTRDLKPENKMRLKTAAPLNCLKRSITLIL